jgi:hypothetical protein
MASILPEIEAFLTAHGLSASRFGELAVGDKNLVKQLRKGRRVWPETEQKLRLYMVSYSRKAA